MQKISVAEIRESNYARYLSLLIRLGLAGVFIVSSINKLPMQMEFADVVQSFNILPEPLAIAYGAALPWVELLAACYLLLGILIKPSAIVVILMCISFLVANITASITGNFYCPDCFGELFRLTIPMAITIDVLMLLASILLLFIPGDNDILSFDAWFKTRFGRKTETA